MNRHDVKAYLAGFAVRFAAVMAWIFASALVTALIHWRMPTDGEIAFTMAIWLGWEWVTEAMKEAE